MMGFGFLGLLVMLIFWVILIVLGIWLVKTIMYNDDPRRTSHPGNPSPREILDQRYARGEINREQYEMMKRDLEKNAF